MTIVGTGRMPACGPLAAPELVVVLDAQLCMSCRAVGRFARQLAAQLPGIKVLFAVPERDTSDVCEFLRRERVSLSVVGLPDTGIVLPANGSELVAFAVGEDGGAEQVWHSAEPMALLTQIQRSLPPSLGKRRNHNGEGKQ
jgi:hypothetical protein